MQHLLFENNKVTGFKSKYMEYIINSLNSLGLTFLHQQNDHNQTTLNQSINFVKRTISDQSSQEIFADLSTTKKTIFFQMTFSDNKQPPYLDHLHTDNECSLPDLK